jgi:hypothetical protein
VVRCLDGTEGCAVQLCGGGVVYVTTWCNVYTPTLASACDCSYVIFLICPDFLHNKEHRRHVRLEALLPTKGVLTI